MQNPEDAATFLGNEYRNLNAEIECCAYLGTGYGIEFWPGI